MKLHQIEQHINSVLEPAKNQDAIYLMAVSGGLDSMVLATILYKLNIKFAIAHCNFGLRNKESDDDEAFVALFCKEKKITCYTTRFETFAFAKAQKISTQMAARVLRYDWFQQLAATYNYKAIITAHHQDDSLETILINLSRNTGIGGLGGIQGQAGNVVRPLITISRQMILNYAKANKLAWREDSSNEKTDYLRNQIRLKTIPALQKISPGITSNLNVALHKVNSYLSLSNFEFKIWEAEHVSMRKGYFTIPSENCLQHDLAEDLAFYLLSEFGFKNSTLKEILLRSNQKGKRFYSEKYELLTTGTEWIINPYPKSKLTSNSFSKNNLNEFSSVSGNLFFTKTPIAEVDMAAIKSDNNKNIAHVDFDKLDNQICVRYFENGDKIKPLGMNGKQKKLSDIFIDAGYHLVKKQTTPLLCSREKIFWIAGLNLSEDYKITRDTTHVLKCTFAPDGF